MKKLTLILLVAVFLVSMTGIAMAAVPSNSSGVWDGADTSYNYNWPQQYTKALGTDAGPHGDYATTSNKCRDCHAVHRASGSYVLLRADTRDAACDFCHADGTGTVVQVAWADTDTSNGHHAGWNEDTYAPDTTTDDTDTGNLGYEVPAGGFGCMDCHSPHDNAKRTVANIEERQASGKGNALLLGRPNKNGTEGNAAYAFCGETPDMTDWCATCHMGNKGLYTDQKNIRDNITQSWDVGYSHDAQTDGMTLGGEKYLTCDTTTTDSSYVYVEPDGTNDGPTCRECHSSTNDGSTVWPHASSGYVLLKDGASDDAIDNVCLDCHKTDALP
jgi:Zn-finger protein